LKLASHCIRRGGAAYISCMFSKSRFSSAPKKSRTDSAHPKHYSRCSATVNCQKKQSAKSHPGYTKICPGLLVVSSRTERVGGNQRITTAPNRSQHSDLFRIRNTSTRTPVKNAEFSTLADFPLSDLHMLGAGQCSLGGPGVPSDHWSAKTKKVVTLCSGSYADITGEPGRLAPQLFSASPET